MRRRIQKTGSADEGNPYWMSFSDMMSALLVIFLLATVVLILQLMERQAEVIKEREAAEQLKEVLRQKEIQFDEEITQLKKAEEVRRTILEEAVVELKRRGIEVEISENNTVLRIPNALLGFETGAYEIQARYAPTALEIGEVLYQVISLENRIDYLDTIFIEGHTDNRAYRGLMGKGNWGLSTFRSISLWQYWSDFLPQDKRLNEMLNLDGNHLFSVSGYAETRPAIEEQYTEDDFKANRRIDIRFTIRKPDSIEYEGVKSLLKDRDESTDF